MAEIPPGDFEITLLLPSEYGLPVEWSRREGWQNGDHDYEMFTIPDPAGFIVGRLNGQIISIIAGINWSDSYASIAGYVTDVKYRGKGFGVQLFQKAMLHTGDRQTCLTAVPEMASKYAQWGFAEDYLVTFSELQLGHLDAVEVPEGMALVDLRTVDFKEITGFDHLFFPAERDAFLRKWINQPNSTSLAAIKADRLVGYGVARRVGEDEHAVEPLYAHSLDIAKALMAELCRLQKTGKIWISAPSNNLNASNFAEHFHLVPVMEAVHMTKNSGTNRRLLHDGVFSITAGEVG